MGYCMDIILFCYVFITFMAIFNLYTKQELFYQLTDVPVIKNVNYLIDIGIQKDSTCNSHADLRKIPPLTRDLREISSIPINH